MTDREAMQMALDWNENHGEVVFAGGGMDAVNAMNKVSEALRAALAQGEQEPVAWMYDFPNPDDPTEIIRDWVAHSLDEVKHCGGVNVRPLYSEPQKREWRSLSSAQTKVLWNLTKKPTEYAAMIDAKLREMNT